MKVGKGLLTIRANSTQARTFYPCNLSSADLASPKSGGRMSRNAYAWVRLRNYTIHLSYVTPDTSSEPRANLIARDRTMSSSDGEYYPYSGQSFVRSLPLSHPFTIPCSRLVPQPPEVERMSRTRANTPLVPCRPTRRASTHTISSP